MPQDDEDLGEWIDKMERSKKSLSRDLEKSEGNLESFSREYKQFKEEEKAAQKKNWYERLASRVSFFEFEFDDMREDHENAINLLDYDISPGQIAPTALFISVVFLVISALIVISPMVTSIPPMPMIFQIFFLLLPLASFFYMVKFPNLKAWQKMMRSSEGLILSVLYMAIYMRSNPSLIGALKFAADHLSGPVARDFRLMLWKIDMRIYNNVREALDDYLERWQPYNKGFVEAFDILETASYEGSVEQRNEQLAKAVNELLGSTKDKMDTFARNLKMPVMALHGLGILLPILGIIMFPLISAFLGGSNVVFYLVFTYNVLIPAVVYFVMSNLLNQRPVSFSTKAGNINREPGVVSFSLFGKELNVSIYFFSVPLFLGMMYLPAQHLYSIFFGSASFSISPSNLVLFKEIMFPLAIGVPVGFHLFIGYRSYVKRQKEIVEMERELPNALYSLGHSLRKGNPIERAVKKAAEDEQLDISKVFSLIYRNITESKMTFYDAVFDERRGAMRAYTSKLIGTILEIISKSAKKGTEIAAKASLNIADYLENISDTQKKLEALLDESLSSVRFLAYILAPLIAGVAVGMGGTISKALYTMSEYTNMSQNVTGGQGLEAGSAGMVSMLDVESVIPPGVLAIVVGFYLLELSGLVGTLYVRLKSGHHPARRNMEIGRVLILSMIIFTTIALVIFAMFGGIISGVGV
ncbi:MAG: hypothetical protein MUP58_02475 [Candidatus Nanohaloarchaeota archaeon QJJ-9]|nr:hypothetical protein [Candidatus Nanohaloarchaeota archaeon QJJ-9]